MIEYSVIPMQIGQSVSWVMPEGLGNLAVISIAGQVTYDGTVFGTSFPLLTVYSKSGDVILRSTISSSSVGNLELFRYAISLQSTSPPWGYGDGAGNSWSSAGFGPLAWNGGERVEVGMINPGSHVWDPILMVYAWDPVAVAKPKPIRKTPDQIGYGCKLYKR